MAGMKMAAIICIDTVPDVFIQAWKDGELCFLLGAFASSASGLPVATQLTRSILDQLLGQARPQISSQEHNVTKDFLTNDVVELIRLEALLGAIESTDVSRHSPGGNHYIAGVASTLASSAIPHSLHWLLHDGLRSGQIPAVFTTNWDCLIEKADSELPGSSIAWDDDTFAVHVGRSHKAGHPGLLAKLHGTADDPKDSPALQARKARSLVHDLLGLGGPMARNARKVFESHVQQYPLLVLGYGGYDPDIHVSLREVRRPICWTVHRDRTRGRKDAERIAKYLPNVPPESAFVFDISPVLRQMFGFDFVPRPGIPEFAKVFEDIEAPRALVAVGLALDHAACGTAAERVMEIAAALPDGQSDMAVQFHRWSHYSAMYGGLYSIRMLRQLLRSTDERSDPARYYELVHYSELAIENCLRGSMLRLFNAWIGRPLAARFLRKQIDFHRFSAVVEDALLNASPQENARIVAAFVNLTLSSVRVWKSESFDDKRRRLKLCMRHAKECRAFGLQGHILRYLGRLSGLMGDAKAADDYFLGAEERFAAISSHGGIAEVAKYRFKTAMAFGTADSLDAEALVKQYKVSRGIDLPYVRLLNWAKNVDRRVPLVGPLLARMLTGWLRKYLGSIGGF